MVEKTRFFDAVRKITSVWKWCTLAGLGNLRNGGAWMYSHNSRAARQLSELELYIEDCTWITALDVVDYEQSLFPLREQASERELLRDARENHQRGRRLAALSQRQGLYVQLWFLKLALRRDAKPVSMTVIPLASFRASRSLHCHGFVPDCWGYDWAVSTVDNSTCQTFWKRPSCKLRRCTHWTLWWLKTRLPHGTKATCL